jgi:branched-chain amino acid transport system permease protein
MFWKWTYLAAVGLVFLTLIVNYRVSRARFGYYLMAIREDEDTASAVGIDTARCKLESLMLSAFLTALAGSLYASAFQFIIPDSVLPLEISVQIAIIAMLGGAGTLIGPVVGAVVLLSASELFKNQFKESHLLIYGVLIVVVVLFMPEGIVGAVRHLFRRREKAPDVPTGLTPGGANLAGSGAERAS